MSLYKINWAEVKRKGNTNGRDWAITEMSLEDKDGNITEKVSTFDSVMPGQEIEGSIEKNDKGYLNFKKLEAPNFIKENRSNFKTQQMEKIIERKEQGIAKIQDNKDWSIKVSSTMRDAVLLAIEYHRNHFDEDLKDLVLKWREWLWNNWDVEADQYPPFK
jgi:hypothetical protein